MRSIPRTGGPPRSSPKPCASTPDGAGFSSRPSIGLITWLNFPSRHGIAAAASMGLDAICLHTGTFGLRLEQPRPADHSAERVIDVAHQAGLEVLAWVPKPAEAVRLAQAGADAFCVDDVPGVLAALAGSGPARR
jgi:glycerophosphoryl diester phosphodiesterase